MALPSKAEAPVLPKLALSGGLSVTMSPNGNISLNVGRWIGVRVLTAADVALLTPWIAANEPKPSA